MSESCPVTHADVAAAKATCSGWFYPFVIGVIVGIFVHAAICVACKKYAAKGQEAQPAAKAEEVVSDDSEKQSDIFDEDPSQPCSPSTPGTTPRSSFDFGRVHHRQSRPSVLRTGSRRTSHHSTSDSSNPDLLGAAVRALSFRDQLEEQHLDSALIDMLSTEYDTHNVDAEGQHRSPQILWEKVRAALRMKVFRRAVWSWTAADGHGTMNVFISRFLLQACSIAPNQQKNAWDLMSQIDDWQTFNIFELEILTPSVLTLVAHYCIIHSHLSDALCLPVHELHKICMTWEAAYNAAPYHNAMHAADVTQSIYHALWTAGLGRHLDPLLLLATQLAAPVHDIGHPGVSNSFLVEQRHELAVKYSDKSVLENMHCVKAFEVLQEQGLDLLRGLPVEDAKRVRHHMVDIILGTDMTFHNDSIAEVEHVVAEELDWSDPEMQKICAKVVLHVADISNPTRPFNIFWHWGAKILDEFYNQGEQERNLGLTVKGGFAFLDRAVALNEPKFQLGFTEFIALPLYTAVATLPDLEFFDRLAQLKLNIELLGRRSETRRKEMEAESP